MEEDLEEDDPEEVEGLALAPVVEQNEHPQHEFHSFGLQLFDNMEDEEILQMVQESGFVVPNDVDSQEDIISWLRQLDQP